MKKTLRISVFECSMVMINLYLIFNLNRNMNKLDENTKDPKRYFF